MFESLVSMVQELYGTDQPIPLHRPVFSGHEKQYLLDTIDSSFVSSVGEYVNQFEQSLSSYTGAGYAIATVNGTAALHIALKVAGVEAGTEVITQSLSFVATSNAIRYCGAQPVFVDVDRGSLGLSAESLEQFLEEHTEIREDGCCWNIRSGKRIVACLSVHTFGIPAKLDALERLCECYHIALIEDCAESLGSLYKGKHTGNHGKLAAISFNGNKIVTTGGGGMVLTNDRALAERVKHLTTTAKVPHQWEFEHDEVGYNYRLPNLNAALGVAQMEQLPAFVEKKRMVADAYQQWGERFGVLFLQEHPEDRSNYWLNGCIVDNKAERDQLLEITNKKGVMTRPAWKPMHQLEINRDCQAVEMKNTDYIADRLVNLPSSVP